MMSEVEIRDMARRVIAGNKTGNYDYKHCLGMVYGFGLVLGYTSSEAFVASLKVD